MQKRVVFASTKDVVDKINDYVLSLIPGEEKEYCSADSVDKSDELLNPAFGVLTAEFLNSLKTSGIPNHKLIIKVGTPIILLRNLDQADGLCNGTRLIVTRLGSSVVEAAIITGPNPFYIFTIPKNTHCHVSPTHKHITLLFIRNSSAQSKICCACAKVFLTVRLIFS